MLAICEKRSGNSILSTQHVQECIDKYPDYKDALLMKAQLLSEKCKYKSALEVYSECPMSPLVHAGMGDCYRSLKKFAEAIQEYTKGIKKSNLQDKIINQLTLKRSIAYTDFGKLDEALVDLQQVLHSEPNNVKAHLQMGNILGKGASNARSKPEDALLHFL